MYELASLQEAIGNSAYAVHTSNVQGKEVLIFGLGPAGLNAIACAKACGARKVICVGGSAVHVRLAKRLGGTVILYIYPMV